MNQPILIDIALAAVLLLFVWLGAKKGFILSLCSLVAVLVALVGANLIADALTPKVAESIQPRLEQSIQEHLENAVLETGLTDEQSAAVQALAQLKEKGGLYALAADEISWFLNHADFIQFPSLAELATTAALSVAEQLARGVIFSVAFLLVLMAWFFVSHALDLVSKLPVINSLNHTLGGVLGAVKGLVIVYVAAWVLCDLTWKIPPDVAGQTHLLSFLLAHGPMELLKLA